VRNTVVVWGLLVFLALGCNLIRIVPDDEKLPTELVEETDTPAVEVEAPAQEDAQSEEPTSSPEPTAAPLPIPTPFFLASLSTCPRKSNANDVHGNCCQIGYAQDTTTGLCTFCPVGHVKDEDTGLCKVCEERDENGACTVAAKDIQTEGIPPPTLRHGLLIALVLPIFVLGIPWIIAEIFVVRYVQPRSIDLSTVRIKAQDGLFLEAIISLTARRSLTLASTRLTWSRVSDVVEKTLEQELIYEAINYPTLEELERNLKPIAERFSDLDIVRELKQDFGAEVMRFNVEAQYPQETRDALNRRAEAAAGGTAYLAYAQAAHLDPDSQESRELYKVYQETRGQVDAARNLGGGLTSLADVFSQRNRPGDGDDDDVGT
jgi:hypothetical protein